MLSQRSTSGFRLPDVRSDGTVGATLIASNNYGMKKKRKGLRKPKNHTPTTVAVETTATRVKVSVRHLSDLHSDAGLAIFRATGAAPRS